jgi:FlgN protein.
MTYAESTIDWATEVAALLDELTCVQEELLALLERKREQLGARNTAARAEIRVREKRLAARLALCQERRADLLAAKSKEEQGGCPGKPTSDPGGRKPIRSRGRTKLLRRPMQLLRSDNILNWVQAQRALLQVAQLVESVATLSASRP